MRGDGVYVEESRTLPPFEGVDAEDDLSVFVTAGSASQSVTVSGDGNVVPHIATFVEPRTVGTTSIAVLHVKVSEDYEWTIPPRVVIEVPAITYLGAQEVRLAEVKDAAAPAFHVDARASHVRLAGPGGDRLFVALDAGTLDAAGYPVALAAEVSLAGESVAGLRSDGPVAGTAAGASRIHNAGEGPCGEVSFTGAAAACCVDVTTGCPLP